MNKRTNEFTAQAENGTSYIIVEYIENSDDASSGEGRKLYALLDGKPVNKISETEFETASGQIKMRLKGYAHD